jgi:hypothetical protein
MPEGRAASNHGSAPPVVRSVAPADACCTGIRPAAASPTNGNSEPVATTLCDVVAHPEKFTNKLVRFRASFGSDGLEHSVLIHSGCKLGIVPYPAADGKERSDVEAFDEAVRASAPDADKTSEALILRDYRS